MNDKAGRDTPSSKIVRFEDLIAWQKSRVLAREIYLITGQGEFARDFGLRDQIPRAAVLMMSKVSEGFERRGRAEFQHFLSIAKASCAEVRSQLYVAHDVGYLHTGDFERLANMADETSRIIGALRASLRQPRPAT